MHDVFQVDRSNCRLDTYLAERLSMTRSQIKKLISEGQILVNGQTVKAGLILQGHETVSIYMREFTLEPEPIEFKVQYEDRDLAVISKPQGLVVHPGAGNDRHTLVNGLLSRFDTLSDSDDYRPGIVHRLDKDTSGLMIIAKTNETRDALIAMFKAHAILKEYLAILTGKLETSKFVNAPIGRDPLHRIRFAVTECNSKEAQSEFMPCDFFGDFTLCRVKILTGRTHQIRVHAKYIHHPVVGDLLYGMKNKYGIETQLLHAYHLEFKHPITGQLVSIQDEVPNRFHDFMKKVKR
ncbi:RluA family pseudouridine synthase [Peptoniphilus equinus]|uniref:Pseudouridine synthase n=1 Tax=Peptoniphilus equinus TaxID=3016343 RepID=A0ABY7QVG7_9FIRM|nr:RluA family pseudouridine synthase [Peptoniphilus equinus]WBW50712.1 RluA family pseudouridine synthase [Peptoniphilus equinus]